MSLIPTTSGIELPELPWSPQDLEPVISARTIDFHYNKHHRGYVDKLNKAIAGKKLASLPLDELIRMAAGDTQLQGVFNNAAQVWNHTFYWRSLAPNPGPPSDILLAQLKADFGSLDNFSDRFADAATGLFGSGWAWLVLIDGHLQIKTTSNANTPLTEEAQCLLAIDVWEHAYYLDYQNDRAAHVKAVIERLLNWPRASSLFQAAAGR